MKFLVDECIGPTVSNWLRKNGYDVLSIFDSLRGLDDLSIIQIAYRENRIILTNDKDFGKLVYKENQKHSGIILFRLKDETPPNKIKILEQILKIIPSANKNFTIIASERNIRLKTN